VVDADGREVGQVDAVELVTIGQRRGLDVGGQPTPRYAVDVDVATATVTIGDEPQRRVAPGQSVVLYRDDLVVGGGIAQR
jgi:tRNA-uridine 2-sulfurtransferase